MDKAAQAILLIAEWREEIVKKMRQGEMPAQEMLETMANLMEAVAGLFRLRLNNPSWKQFYHNMHKGYIPVDFSERLLQWEKEACCLYEQNKEEEYLCNICKEKVVYNPSPSYFQEQQKSHGFPYWDAVFESMSRKHRTCPMCQSMDRERMISLFLDMLRPVEGKKLKVLHIAPSQALDRYLMNRDDIECETTDLYMENVSFHADIQNLSMLEEETYDVIICSHILEHIEDDVKAMMELKRILKEDGVCIFLVPLVIGLDRTDEAFGLPDGENWRRFGQDDHVRLYGRDDFLDRLIQTGYRVHVLRADYFGEELWRQNGLSDIHCLYVASKRDIGLGVEPYQINNGAEELVSVIIPTWNREKLVGRSVKSVLAQTYRNLEVIVVDDASTDQTEAALQEIEDARVRYIKLETNGGANHARNVGVKAARGQYVAFNDSDDEWLPEKLEKQMKLMRQSDMNDVGCVYCMMTRHYDETSDQEMPEIVPSLWNIGENLVGNIFRFMQSHMFISTQMLLLKREAIEDAGYFNESLGRLQDWELLLRIAEKYKFTLVQEKLVNAYVQGNRVSANDEAFFDTVHHVVCRHNMALLNIKGYEALIDGTIRLSKTEKMSLSETCKKRIVDDIENDGVFPEEKLLEIRRILDLDVPAENENGLLRSEIELMKQINAMQKEIDYNNRMLHEILWAQVFHSSKNGYQWLSDDTALWPGRWGVGYQYMYVVSRILDSVHPRSILETGLGQSTRLIGSYIKYMEKKYACRHVVIEHDQGWIDTFRREFALSNQTQIVLRNLGIARIHRQGEAQMTYIYQNLDEIINDTKFDFISLDAPYGTDDANGYSRIDILSYLPDCLAESFCIVLDDYNRSGEKNTVECMKSILSKNHISYTEAVYRGEKDLYLLVSEDWKFLCTL